MEQEDLIWLCIRLVIEVLGPAFSGDLTAIGDAELVLLSRVRDEIGGDRYPNDVRKVACTICGAAGLTALRGCTPRLRA